MIEVFLPKFWVFYYDIILRPEIVQVSRQQVSLVAQLDNIKCVISVVYASVEYVERRVLWVEMESLKYKFCLAWSAVRDYNSVLLEIFNNN